MEQAYETHPPSWDRPVLGRDVWPPWRSFTAPSHELVLRPAARSRGRPCPTGGPQLNRREKLRRLFFSPRRPADRGCVKPKSLNRAGAPSFVAGGMLETLSASNPP